MSGKALVDGALARTGCEEEAHGERLWAELIEVFVRGLRVSRAFDKQLSQTTRRLKEGKPRPSIV